MPRHSMVVCLVVLLGLSLDAPGAGPPAPSRMPRLRAVDLDVGESSTVELSDGTTARVKVVALDEERDSIRSAIRRAQVKLEINGQPIELTSGTYHLPVTVAGVQVDCPVTSGHLTNSTADHWGLRKAVRLRLWPAGSPWIEPGTFSYPLRERWFATETQMGNEPTFVGELEHPTSRKIYYHAGCDTGGAEGLVDVVAATDALVVSRSNSTLPGYEDSPVMPRYDVVYLLDDRGWYYRYSHMKTIDSAIQPGARVKMQQKIGVLGKEGASGGWSHLHFEPVSRQPSGKWGTQDGYAFLWEAMLQRDNPPVVAVARPHHVAWTGDRVTLDGSLSWSRTKKIARYDWTFCDGSTASGPKVERTYAQAGEYSEILKTTDDLGNYAYDFAIVQVNDRQAPTPPPPSIHPVYFPTQDVKPGDPITFKVRTFDGANGPEIWDFGDGSSPVETRSDGNARHRADRNPDGYAMTTHSFAKPGDYLVRVERADSGGRKAIGRLYVQIGQKK